MTTPQTNVKTQLTELVSDAFEAYCEDITGMFGVDMDSTSAGGMPQTIKEVRKSFKKLSAVITIQARGALEGNFHILYNREALFTLAGTIVMLPEERIKAVRKTGTTKEAEELYDAVGETGNLLAGSWDRVFREGLEGHQHFLQIGTFIGNPWDDVSQHLGLSEDEEFLFFPCEMKVGSFGVFHCGVIFPEAIFCPASENTESNTDEETSPEVAEAPEQNPSPQAEQTTEAVSESEINEVAESPPEQEIVEETANTTDAADAAEPEKQDAPIGEQTETGETVTAATETESPPVPEQNSGSTVSQTIQEMAHSLPILPKEQAQALLNVPAKDIMNKQVLWIDPNDSVQQTMEKMQQAGAPCALAGKSDHLEGIVTWIDIAEAISIYLRPVFSKWRRPVDDATLQIRIKIIMTRPVRTINAQTPLSVILEEMCRHRIRCLPVVNDQGNIQGILSAMDIFKALLRTDSDFSMIDKMPQTDAESAA